MKVSIVLATFNGARYLLPQLESLSRQTLLPAELIICDDGSQDETLEIVKLFARTAPFPVRVRANPVQLGYADNFLQGCELASGEWIALCDQDDIWRDEKLGTIAAWNEAHPGAAMIIHRSEVVDEDLNSLDCSHPEVASTRYYPPGTLSVYARPPGFSMVFQASLLSDFGWRDRPQDLQFPSGQTKHDSWLFTLANITSGIRFLSDSLALYRRHGGNSSHFQRGSKFLRRAGQMLNNLRPVSTVTLERLRYALEDHMVYFRDRSETIPSGNFAADIFEQQLLLTQDRISLLSQRRRGRLQTIVKNLRSGLYGSPKTLNRQILAQDLATLWS